jgi:erythromycin esterase-like protein
MRGSVEELFHDAGRDRFMLLFGEERDATRAFRKQMLERAIGVIYRPETERQSHYFHTRLSDQFDAVIHIDETRAVEPLERSAEWEAGEVMETFPFGV